MNCEFVGRYVLFLVHAGDSACFEFLAVTRSSSSLHNKMTSSCALAYSGNKFFRVGPNILEKFVPGGTNFRGVQIKRDKPILARAT